ncbi:type I methionyl aminopeptidase [Myxococcota bacterium]|jgi:methionyl aminopeptidase|nr:type I methionyl aminopeptidase [Myxococcota bacterium]MBU1242400.1 type I methionyl aminopeptidase [Myxococcota bacterium]MBU1411291.1 type I methionyl aminopeptidase [Myxococcota bacterium]MBU1509666.1 type I methionyl aminopeptidase [Myxococcota bacterium]PKN25804.1 MAG: type I methionyl aminopeptidase [Deltaproteobacteria bacterium HGW-Deltaproteobacteria-22]
MHVRLKARSEIEKLRRANLMVSDVLDLCQEMARPGVSTWDMEEAARSYIQKVGARSAFLNYQPAPDMAPYPAVLCTSRNEKVVHGIPDRREILEEGDILSVDCGIFYDGYCGDAARTYAIGKVSEKAAHLIRTTEESLELAIAKMVPGNRVSDVGDAIQRFAEGAGYQVVRDFVGHGIGQEMHEPPQVPNLGPPGRGLLLQPGLVLAIEPMLCEGTWKVSILDDGWTVVTRDRKLACHFEHSVAVTDGEPLVLSRR